jgi:hypothetical protein
MNTIITFDTAGHRRAAGVRDAGEAHGSREGGGTNAAHPATTDTFLSALNPEK